MHATRKLVIFVVVAVVSFARGTLVSAQDARLLAGLDELMATELERWSTPGAAVAIVRKGEPAICAGFGLRDVENALPVTADTLFAIGSTTKAFTCALLADLAEEELVDWNAPARRVLPELELHDEHATLHITPLDLVTHRSGLPRHDLVWYGSSATRAELLERVRWLEPSAELRSEFQYQNLMYMTAGYLAGRAAGSTWEEALRARLLVPLGMLRSNTSIAAMQADSDHALPYAQQAAVVARVPFRELGAIGPAGSINSSAVEMARWVAFLLDEGGRADGERLLESASVDALFEPAIVASLGGPEFAEDGVATYARGWMVQTYRGHERVHHGGRIDGFMALVTLFRADGFGIVVLSNRGETLLPWIVTRWIADHLLELEPIDWSARLQSVVAEQEAAVAAAKVAAAQARKAGTSPSHPLADYAGAFRDRGYGTLTVSLVDSALSIALNGLALPLEHWHYDVFRVTAGKAEGTLVQFHMDTHGELAALSVELEPRVAPIRFERVPQSNG